jgi:hypothetical protein
LRLAATHLDALFAVRPRTAAALVVGIIRQFVPDFLHRPVRDALVETEAARAARLIPRKVKPAASGLRGRERRPVRRTRAPRRGARRRQRRRAAGLAGPAGRAGGRPGAAGMRDPALALSPIVANPEALALLRFAVSDAYDDLAAAMEGG